MTRTKVALLTAAAVSALAAGPSVGQEYFFRSKAVAIAAPDLTPDPFSFPDRTGLEPDVAAASSAVALTGHAGVRLSVSGGGYQICSTVACTEMDGGPVATSPSTPIAAGTLVRLVATPPGFGQSAVVTLTAGNGSASFRATARAKRTAPAVGAFTAQSGVAVGATATSNVATVAAHDGVSVSASLAEFRLCADATCSANPAWNAAGTIVSAPATTGTTWAQLRTTAGAAGSTKTARLTVGGTAADWSVSSETGIVESGDGAPAYVYGSAGGLRTGCRSMNGKICMDAQFQLLGGGTFRTAGSNVRGTTPNNGWYSAWWADSSTASAAGAKFCKAATGNAGVVSATYTFPAASRSKAYIYNSTCEQLGSYTPCFQGSYDGASYVFIETIGTDGRVLNVQCSAF